MEQEHEHEPERKLNRELHSLLTPPHLHRGAGTKLYKSLTAEAKAEFDILNRSIRNAESREE